MHSRAGAAATVRQHDEGEDEEGGALPQVDVDQLDDVQLLARLLEDTAEVVNFDVEVRQDVQPTNQWII